MSSPNAGGFTYHAFKNKDFLINERFVLLSLFVSALVLGVCPQLFLRYFTYDLELVLLSSN